MHSFAVVSRIITVNFVKKVNRSVEIILITSVPHIFIFNSYRKEFQFNITKILFGQYDYSGFAIVIEFFFHLYFRFPVHDQSTELSKISNSIKVIVFSFAHKCSLLLSPLIFVDSSDCFRLIPETY